MKLSICIVTWNTEKYIDKCLKSIYKNQPSYTFEVLVADNNSSDKTTEIIKLNFPQVNLIKCESNFGFAKANNILIEKSKGEYVLLLNPDTEVFDKSIDKLIDFLEKNNDVAIVAPKLINSNGTLQRSCMGFPTLAAMAMRQTFLEFLLPFNSFTKKYLMIDFNHDKTMEVEQPMGACLLIRRKALDAVGAFDENYFMFFDEVDLCFRIKKNGWKIMFFPDSVVMHYGGTAVKKWSPLKLSKVWTSSRNYFFKKHFGNKAVFALYLFDFLKIAIIILIFMILIYLIQKILLLGNSQKYSLKLTHLYF